LHVEDQTFTLVSNFRDKWEEILLQASFTHK